jgi:pimeloyl-ACP methyl ester carboxylesterase
MPVIRAGAFNLDYTDTGSGPAVVLVHSSASGYRQWRLLTEVLQARYRVIAVNLFGYGKTSPWPGMRSLTAADQAELVVTAAELAPGPVTLVGHSLGGVVALEAAVKLSRRVRAVVTFEPILLGHLKVHGPADAYDEIAAVARRFNELARPGGWNAAGEWFVDYWSGPGTWAAMPDERKQNLCAMLPALAHEWGMATTGIRPLEGWSAITASVHLIYAQRTRTPTRAIMKLLARSYPDWHVHAVPAGGHMAPLARPDLVNPLIAAIIDRPNPERGEKLPPYMVRGAMNNVA